MDHRGTERSLYDKLQQAEHAAAREFLESRLADVTLTYEQICGMAKASGLFEEIKDITPTDLTRYRQRKAKSEARASVMALVEADAPTLIEAAAQNPAGKIAKYLRRQLAEYAVARIDEQIDKLDALSISREAARHALVEQRDRKLDLEEMKADLERRRVELAEQQADLDRDRFKIAADTWACILGWLVTNAPELADAFTQKSEELLSHLEEWVVNQAAQKAG